MKAISADSGRSGNDPAQARAHLGPRRQPCRSLGQASSRWVDADGLGIEALSERKGIAFRASADVKHCGQRILRCPHADEP
jgi:hypothetical protein